MLTTVSEVASGPHSLGRRRLTALPMITRRSSESLVRARKSVELALLTQSSVPTEIKLPLSSSMAAPANDS